MASYLANQLIWKNLDLLDYYKLGCFSPPSANNPFTSFIYDIYIDEMVLRLGSVAPNFKAVTTKGEIDFHQHINGSWAILFSHPADFSK